MIFCQNIETNIVKPILDVLESDNNIEFALIRTPVSFIKDYNTIANMIIAKPFDITKADKTLSLVLENFLKYLVILVHLGLIYVVRKLVKEMR